MSHFLPFFIAQKLLFFSIIHILQPIQITLVIRMIKIFNNSSIGLKSNLTMLAQNILFLLYTYLLPNQILRMRTNAFKLTTFHLRNRDGEVILLPLGTNIWTSPFVAQSPNHPPTSTPAVIRALYTTSN